MPDTSNLLEVTSNLIGLDFVPFIEGLGQLSRVVLT